MFVALQGTGDVGTETPPDTAPKAPVKKIVISNETIGEEPMTEAEKKAALAKTQPKPAAKPSATKKATPPPRTPRAAGTKVLGRYAQTTDQAKIYATPNSRSKVYYTAKPFEYLCVNWGPTGEWMKVLMSNGVQAYVKKDMVALLPYEVTTKVSSPATSRLGGTSTARAAAAQWGLNFVGTKYVWGGNSLTGGIDCSAFIQKLYGKIGLNLPRTAAEQALVGTPIQSLEDLIPGDRLYFWENKRNKIGHTGIYLGNGYFLHSSRGKNGVDTDFLSEKWRKILVAARR